MNGDAERSCRLLGATLDRSASARPADKLWALTVLAETSARIGSADEAGRYFATALALGQRDAYLLGAYADFLLDQGRAPEVAALLKDETRADGLLLRLALAEAALHPRPSSLDTHVAMLRARFDANRLRGDQVHQREEARFTLELMRQPREALRLAQANWQVQREPADARVLFAAAVAANDPLAAEPAREFVRTNHLQDVQLARLEQSLAALAAK